MLYSILRNFLFYLEPELAHSVTLKTLKIVDQVKLLKLFIKKIPIQSVKVMGLTFPNPIGLAAGLDKNGDYIDCLAKLGFGFLEIGTITPKPQTGNPKPRLFRIPQAQALINRMGFNNNGVEYLHAQLQRIKYRGILGINIGKNAATPIEQALDDYIICLRKVYVYASYITINISSPNTPGLRKLQNKEYLEQLLMQLKQEQLSLANQHDKYVPLVIKIAPDLIEEEIKTMVDAFCTYAIDAVIATNTTISRENVAGMKYGHEQGGLSGKPLSDKATQVVASLKQHLGSRHIPIIASGGVMSVNDVEQKIKAGADLVQLYTGLIYTGPGLIYESVTKFKNIAC
jgi:dihydroorotate dehydrogenase